MDQSVSLALEGVKQAVISRARAAAVDLTPWFAENSNRLSVLAQMLAQLVAKQAGDEEAVASFALGMAEKIVAEKSPPLAGWFERNRRIVQRLAVGLVRALRPPSDPPSPPQAQPPEPEEPEALVVEPKPDASLGDEEETAALERDANLIAGQEVLIRRYLMDNRLEGANESILARLDSDQLVGELAGLVDRRDQRERRARKSLAAHINGLDPAVRGAGFLKAIGKTWASLSSEDLPSLLQKAAAHRLVAITGLLLELDHRRPDLREHVAALVSAQGTLDRSGRAVSLGAQGESLPIEQLNPIQANILLGARAAESLSVRVEQKRAPRAQKQEVAQQPEPARSSDPLPPDLRAPKERLEANIKAIEIIARGTESVLPDERAILREYSGFGGLSLKGLEQRLPPEWVPKTVSLVHEYYTPTVVAHAIGGVIRGLLPSIPADEGKIQALEPSAGIGRLIEGCSGDGFDSLRWTACELSRLSSRILTLMRPDIAVHEGPFEEWAQANLDLQGQFGLVVSNPPYGERGKFFYLDPDPAYRDKKAYVYVLRRTTDYLKPGGLGVFLIPSGFMTGLSPQLAATRRQILLRNHLIAAFRLPSESEDGRSLFPGALLVTDVVLLRSRGGELEEIAEDDRFIVEGRYFAENPAHVLGREVGREGDEDDQTSKPRWGYQVRGTFARFPDFTERPLCRDCKLKPITLSRPKRPAVVLSDEAREALQLARRTSQYLAEVARGEPESLKRALALHGDLKEALLAWHAQPQEARLRVAGMLKLVPELQSLFTAKTDAGLLPAIETPPMWEPRFAGRKDDIAGQASFLFGQKRSMTWPEVVDFHRSLGGELAEDTIRAALIAANFAFDEGRVVPGHAYYSGALWERFDRAKAAASQGDPQAAAQAAKLLELIKPAAFSDMSLEPRLGWLPLPVVSGFMTSFLSKYYRDTARYVFERNNGILTLEGVSYVDLAHYSKPLVELLGYLNHDMLYFRPKTSEKEDLEKVRVARAGQYRDHFIEWLEENPEAQQLTTETFNRTFRGWVMPAYPPDDLEIARWNPKYPLYPYQISGVRRLVANHGGGLFFDVGLGKTRTMLATLALARQQGWARRPVICMPNSMIWNWIAEIERVLPDFRVIVIGAKKKVVLRGARKGQIESETDTPRERADKWQRFKAGLYDVALLTYSTLSRTQMRPESLIDLVRNTAAIQREIGFQLRSVEQRIRVLETKARRGKLTENEASELERLRAAFGKMDISERREAVKVEKEEGFIARLLTLPPNQEYDPGIFWEDLAIDWLAFDESHIGKNLWTVGAREGGEPRFLGAPQEGSDIAWQMFFRSAIVRRHAGGSGIHLADATPAKNSPLEFLSLLSLLDDQVWTRLGVSDPEQYLTQFLKIERKMIVDTDLTAVEAPCVVGFQNLDQLREVLYRYGEFRTAKQVGLKIPEPRSFPIEVQMDAAQEEKFEKYLKEYQTALGSTVFDPSARLRALGLLQRMALVGVHAELDEPPQGAEDEALPADPADSEEGETRKKRKRGWTFANAHMARSYSSPKLDEIARLILQRPDCGHLVFLENIPVHFWLRERLVELGFDRERIAVLNAETAQSTMARQRIAEGFTSDDAKYDVVIANKIAYEGLNLQGRTCAIYHGDLPYEPATLQQRNGRGQRQGNRYDVIDIYYILSKRSMDMARFQLISGKREWMAAIVESAASETNNPAAQADLSPEDWLIFLSRDVEMTQKLLAAKKAAQREEEINRTVKLAWSLVRGIAVRHRDSASADLFARTKLMEDIAKLLEDLNQIDPQVWPWKFIAPHIRANPVLSFAPAKEGAVWEGGRYQRVSHAGKVIDSGEIGKISFSPKIQVGFREQGSVQWDALGVEEAFSKWELTRPDDWQREWPALEQDIGPAMRQLLWQIVNEGVWVFRDLRLYLATDSFTAGLWATYGPAIVDALAASRASYQVRAPIVTDVGLELANGDALKSGGRVLPFTEDGFAEFLRLGKQSKLKWSELEGIAEWWWGRNIPRNLLAERNTEERVAA